MYTPGSSPCITAVLKNLHRTLHRIEPILYERIESLGSSVAPALLQAITTKDRAFLDLSVRALAVSGDVNLKYVKPIFAACSRGIVSFSAWGTTVNPLTYLPFIHSPYLRRLALISNPVVPAAARDNDFNIPTEILTMLTHVVVVSDSCWTPWYDLDRALKVDPTASSAPAASLTATPTTLASFAAFQNLTHFAVVQKLWPYTLRVRKVAKKLRYFVILSQFKISNQPSIISSIRLLNDRRFVVVNMGHFSDWPQGDSRCVTTFWETVETLVLGGFISDQGDRW